MNVIFQSSRYRALAAINQHHRGFTLLELLVVLIIIAIISTTSIGAIRFFDDDSPKKTSRTSTKSATSGH